VSKNQKFGLRKYLFPLLDNNVIYFDFVIDAKNRVISRFTNKKTPLLLPICYVILKATKPRQQIQKRKRGVNQI